MSAAWNTIAAAATVAGVLMAWAAGGVVGAAAACAGAFVGFGVGPALRLIDRMNDHYVRDLRLGMERLRVPTRWLRPILRAWLAALVGVVVGFGVWAGMPPVAAALALLVYAAPRVLLAVAVERRRVKLRDQMVQAARQIAAHVRANAGLPDAVTAAAAVTPDPLGVELKEVATLYRDGIRLEDSLARLRNRMQIDAVSLFVVAVLVTFKRGGDLAAALTTISRSLEEIQRVERKRESDTASGWMLVWMLAIFPFGFLAAYTLADPDAVRPVYDTWPGQVVLSVVILIVAGCVWWARRILAKIR